MQNCGQTDSQSIYDHGVSVAKWYSNFYNFLHLDEGNELIAKYIPEKTINILKSISSSYLTPENLYNYHLYHDCGKPFCIQYDENNKRHFPNHANISYTIWMDITKDDFIGWFILHDMDLHLLNTNEAELLLKDLRSSSLLLSAWAEIFSNALMFGGFDSTNFKIKLKHLCRITNKLEYLYNC